MAIVRLVPTRGSFHRSPSNYHLSPAAPPKSIVPMPTADEPSSSADVVPPQDVRMSSVERSPRELRREARRLERKQEKKKAQRKEENLRAALGRNTTRRKGKGKRPSSTSDEEEEEDEEVKEQEPLALKQFKVCNAFALLSSMTQTLPLVLLSPQYPLAVGSVRCP